MTLNWVLILWAMGASASLTLAAMHLLVWLKNRTAWDNLLFSLAAIAAVATASCEIWMMRAETPAEFGEALRWLQAALWMVYVLLTGFVLLRLRAGRIWLAVSICAGRTLSLALNFLVGANLNYLEITHLRHIRFLGESVAVAQGVANPWMLVGQLSLVLLVIFIADAAVSVWRRGERRLALVTGGGILLSALGAGVQSILVLWGIIDWPLALSPFFMVILLAMSYEMSRAVLRAAQLAAHLEESEAALRRSELRYDQAAEAAHIAAWECDLARDEIWTTDRGRALLGFAPGRRIDARSVAAVMHPEDRDAVCETFMQSRDAGGTYQGECRVLLPGGGVRWVATRCRMETDAGGNPVVVRGVSFDVTERKWAQERFERLAERVPVGVIMIDPRGRITLANRQIEADFAYSHLELVGQPVELLIGGPFQAGHEFGMERLYAELTDRSMADGVVMGRHKDGSDIPVQISLNPIQTSQGPEVVATIVNVTERLRAAQEIAEQRNELAHLSRVSTLNELSGAIGHELNQPLQAILSNAQAAQWLLAAERPNLDEIREILHDIVRDDRRAGEVIQALRTLLKKGDTRFESLDVNDLARDVLRLVASELLGSRVAVSVALAPDLPLIRGRRVQLQQVLLNLIINACEAMADSSRHSRALQLTTQLNGDESVLVCVTDRGPGIPPQHLERVFEAFYTTKTSGLGLGLSVCRGIISAHGGRLWAADHGEAGARFCFTIPGE